MGIIYRYIRFLTIINIKIHLEPETNLMDEYNLSDLIFTTILIPISILIYILYNIYNVLTKIRFKAD